MCVVCFFNIYIFFLGVQIAAEPVIRGNGELSTKPGWLQGYCKQSAVDRLKGGGQMRAQTSHSSSRFKRTLRGSMGAITASLTHDNCPHLCVIFLCRPSLSYPISPSSCWGWYLWNWLSEERMSNMGKKAPSGQPDETERCKQTAGKTWHLFIWRLIPLHLYFPAYNIPVWMYGLWSVLKLLKLLKLF